MCSTRELRTELEIRGEVRVARVVQEVHVEIVVSEIDSFRDDFDVRQFGDLTLTKPSFGNSKTTVFFTGGVYGYANQWRSRNIVELRSAFVSARSDVLGCRASVGLCRIVFVDSLVSVFGSIAFFLP